MVEEKPGQVRIEQKDQELAALRDIIEKIKTKTFSIDELYAEYHDQWTDYHLDELALVVAGNTLETTSNVIDNCQALYDQISELSYLFGDKLLKLLLEAKWIPLFTAQLPLFASQSPTWDQQVLRLLYENDFLLIVAQQLRPILLPFLRELPDAFPWVSLLDYGLMDSIDLLQETISEIAPHLSPQLLEIPHSSKIAAICLKVWAPTAAAEDLAQISLDEWSRFGLTHADVCDIFAAALSSQWSLGEMAMRYTLLSNLSVDQPTAALEQAMVYTLNCLNATLDKSDAEPPQTWKITQVSLEQVLLDWCVAEGIRVSPDLSDRRKYILSSCTSTVTVHIKENVFWVNEQPIELNHVKNFL